MSTGLPLPDGLEGASLVPLLDDPTRAVKHAAFSQYPRPQSANYKVMGYSLRTEQYRYTEWRTASGDAVGGELYDHHTDPRENVNLAGRVSSRGVAERLRDQLKAGWRAAVVR